MDKIKLADLIKEYSATGFIFVDAGVNSNTPEEGQFVYLDNDGEILDAYGDIEMSPIDPSSPYAGRDDVIYESDWIIDGEGDNPYRFKILF